MEKIKYFYRKTESKEEAAMLTPHMRVTVTKTKTGIASKITVYENEQDHNTLEQCLQEFGLATSHVVYDQLYIEYLEGLHRARLKELPRRTQQKGACPHG